MRQEKKIVCILICIVVMLAVIILACNHTLNQSDKEHDGESNKGSNYQDSTLNNSQGNIQNNISGDGYMYLHKTKEVGNVRFSNIRVKKVTRDKCEFRADVENLTGEYLDSQSVTIKVIDDSGGVDEIFAGLLTKLAPYEPNKFKTQVLADITDMVDIELEIEAIEKNEPVD